VSDWRLLIHGNSPGPWNMAVDEALLGSVSSGGAPTLRLYGWEGPWLSLGYGQAATAARLRACAECGVGVVQRVTGGRAVLHGSDFTYAVAASDADLPAGLEASYEFISHVLLEALADLGVFAERPRPAAERSNPGFDCFATPAVDGLFARGRKLAGSAQRRVRGGILQHGSIRLRPDPEPAARAAGLWPPSATSLEELGWRGERGSLGDLVVAAFSRAVGGRLSPAQLTPEERRGVREVLDHPRSLTGKSHRHAELRASRAPLGSR
jgi:lipoate-protein ligase A